MAAYRLGDGTKPHDVVISSPSGSQVGQAVLAAPIMWSPSGNLLLDRFGALVTPDGRGAGSAFGGREEMPMVWSPIADCVVGSDGDGLIVGVAGRKPVTILSGPITHFSFSKDGTRIFVEGDNDAGTLDLVRHHLSNRQHGIDVLTDGPCDGLHYADYDWPTCSPDGRYIAAVRQNGRLSLLSSNGTFIREIVTDSGYRDAEPIWGPPRTGIVFVRTRTGAPDAPAEVWFVAEGGVPRDTGLRLPHPIETNIRIPWRGFFDWTAAPRPLAPFLVVGD
jgi:hypothetical protein